VLNADSDRTRPRQAFIGIDDRAWGDSFAIAMELPCKETHERYLLT